MITTILCIGLALTATAWAVVVSVRYARLVREAGRAAETAKECLGIARECLDTLSAVELSRTAQAKVEERTDGLLPYFAVCRKSLGRKWDVARYTFDPEDPDDKEYKRVHAEEVAEKLSETP